MIIWGNKSSIAITVVPWSKANYIYKMKPFYSNFDKQLRHVFKWKYKVFIPSYEY